MTDLKAWIIDYLTDNGGEAGIMVIANAAGKAGLDTPVTEISAALKSMPEVVLTDNGFTVTLKPEPSLAEQLLEVLATEPFPLAQIVAGIEARGGTADEARAAVDALKTEGKIVVTDDGIVYLAGSEPAVVETSAPAPQAAQAAPVMTLTPDQRERLELVVRQGAAGSRVLDADGRRMKPLIDGGLVVIGEKLNGQFVSPVDEGTVPAEVKNACARIVDLLRDRANSLNDLRREVGGETVDLATKRLDGILIKHSDKGWSRIDGQVRKTTAEQEAAKKQRAQEAKKPTVEVARPQPAAPVEAPTTQAPAAAVADRHLASIDANMARMAEMFDVAFRGDDLHEGISVRAGRRPTVKAVAQRIAVVLYLADTVMTETQIRDGLTPQQREKRAAALKMAVSKRAVKAHPAMLGQRTRRYELLDPEPLGLSWDALEAEKESLADRASKKALTESARRSKEEQERRERVMARAAGM